MSSAEEFDDFQPVPPTPDVMWAEEFIAKARSKGLVVYCETSYGIPEDDPARCFALLLDRPEHDELLQQIVSRKLQSLYPFEREWYGESYTHKYQTLGWSDMMEHPRTCYARTRQEALLATLKAGVAARGPDAPRMMVKQPQDIKPAWLGRRAVSRYRYYDEF